MTSNKKKRYNMKSVSKWLQFMQNKNENIERAFYTYSNEKCDHFKRISFSFSFSFSHSYSIHSFILIPWHRKRQREEWGLYGVLVVLYCILYKINVRWCWNGRSFIMSVHYITFWFAIYYCCTYTIRIYWLFLFGVNYYGFMRVNGATPDCASI